MSRYVALDWDADTIRLVAGESRGKRVRLLAACAVPADAAATEDVWSSPHRWQRALASALARYDLQGATTVIAVRRGLVQLQDLRLPPAPADELPEMARFQAEKEFGAISERDAFDYLPLGTPAVLAGARPTTPHAAMSDNRRSPAETPLASQAVLAAMLKGDRLDVIVHACQAVQLKPRSITLANCAIAPLLAAAPGDPPVGTELVVERFGATAEMTLVAEGRPVFIRTVRVPQHTSTAPDSLDQQYLEQELKRTLVAAEHRSLSGPAERVTLLVAGPQGEQAIDRLCRTVDRPVRTVDPWSTVDATDAGLPAASEDRAAFGPAIGMLLDAASRRRPAIDWLNPRQPTQKASRHRPLVLAGVAATVAVACLVANTWWKIHQLDRQIARAAQQLGELEQMAQRLAAVERRVAPLDRWLAADPMWLDELYRLVEDFPPPEDAVLTQLQIVPRGESMTMLLEGRVRDHSVIDTLETRLRDAHHDVVPLMSHHDSSRAPYVLQFKSTVTVTPGDRPRSVSPNPERPDREPHPESSTPHRAP